MYCEEFLDEDDVLLRARERASHLGCTPVAPGAGAALRVLAAAVQARAVVEVGTGAGVGSLYLLPELADERFAPFHERRAELETTYRTLVAACGVEDPAAGAALVLALVENVILQRRRGAALAPERIAEAALRVLALDPGPAAADGPALLADLG